MKVEALTLLLDDDAPVISQLTGRSIGIDGTPGDEVPDYLKPVAYRVFALRAERIAFGGTAKSRQSLLGSLRLRSFSAGPYSETYFGPGEAASAKVLDPDPEVHSLLWALATTAMKNYWLQLWGILKQDPFFQVQQFDYHRTARRPTRFGGY